MKVFAANTKEGIVLYTSSDEQRIYSIHNHIIASPSPLPTEISRLPDKSSLEDIIGCISRSGKEAFVAGKSLLGTHLLYVNGGEKEKIAKGEILSIDAQASSHSNGGLAEPKADRNRKKSSRLDTKLWDKVGSIGEALGEMYTGGKPGDKNLVQFGLLCSKYPRLLLGTGVNKTHGNSGSAQSHLPFLPEREKDTERILSNLVSILDRVAYVKEKGLSPRALKKLSLKAGSIALSYGDSSSNMLSGRLNELKSTYYSGRAEKVELRTLPDIMKQTIGSYVHTVKKHISNYGWAVQDELDQAFHSKKRQDIIVGIRPFASANIEQVKYEVAEELSRALSTKKYYAFKSIPFVAVPCEAGDIKSVLGRLKRKDASYLGPSLSRYASVISSAERSSGYYIPEMFLEKAKDMGISLNYLSWSFTGRKISGSGIRNFRKTDEVLWNLRNIGADIAWGISVGDGAKIFIIDTGIQYTHPGLSARFGQDKGWNFIRDGSDPDDDNGHGTHCAGIASGMNTGVAPGTTLFAGKVLDESGSGTTTDIISAIDYGINRIRPDIISMSLGSRYSSSALEAICAEAEQSGIIVFAAAGNEYFGPSYPAACKGVISVAAVDIDNRHADFSNIDSSVDISCPGVDIYSTYPRNRYATLSGTSMATPGAAGSAALAVSAGAMDPVSFKRLMDKTAEHVSPDDPDWEEKYGSGLIRPDMMLREIGSEIYSTHKYETAFKNAVNDITSRYRDLRGTAATAMRRNYGRR